MNTPEASIFFVIFGIILFATYIAIRRQLAKPGLIAGISVVASIITMTLTGLAQGNTIYQAVFAGLVVGSLFSGGTIAMAWYFLSSERRRAILAAQYAPDMEQQYAPAEVEQAEQV
jgi:Na+/H+-translocating membrane pyrophosphatase